MSLQQLLFDENGTLRSGYRFAIFGVGFFILTLFLGGLAYAALMASGIGTDSSSSASFFCERGCFPDRGSHRREIRADERL